MRSLLIASAGLALAGGGAADAQRPVQHGPGAPYGIPGRGTVQTSAPIVQPLRPGPLAGPTVARPHGVVGRPGARIGGSRAPRWGSKIGGRWWGGANAPGGWASYRRPHRGWAVPAYWNAPRFYVNDWSTYGFAQPPQGYNWTRYYDDAVLIDSRGSVYDTVNGVDWDRYDSGGYPVDYAQNDMVYAGPDDRGQAGGYDHRGDSGARYDDPRYDGGRYDDGRYDGERYPRRDNGLGGAAVGAVAGGVAGNVVAGRGNRLGGTLIGAGVGAAAGYAIDKSEDRGRRAQPVSRGYGSGYGAEYAPPSVYGDRGPGGVWVSPDGRTTVTTSSGGYSSVGATTVVVQSAPVVTTTTTTEYFDDAVTYRPRTAWKKRTWRAKPKCNCR